METVTKIIEYLAAYLNSNAKNKSDFITFLKKQLDITDIEITQLTDESLRMKIGRSVLTLSRTNDKKYVLRIDDSYFSTSQADLDKLSTKINASMNLFGKKNKIIPKTIASKLRAKGFIKTKTTEDVKNITMRFRLKA